MMHPFLSPFLVAVLVAVALPAAAQDALHRTQLEVANCRFDMNHDGVYETSFRPQSSNPDCPCYSASAPPRAATEPDWPVDDGQPVRRWPEQQSAPTLIAAAPRRRDSCR